MAKNDVVLLDSLLSKAKTQYVTATDESELLELFCFDHVLKDYDLSIDELESGWTDGGHDGGLDGFFIHVDGRTADPDASEYAAKRHPEIALDIFTVKHGATFEQQPVDTLIGSITELLDLRIEPSEFKYPYNGSILEQRKLFYDIYVQLAERQPNLTITVHYCSRGDVTNLGEAVSARALVLKELIESLFGDATTTVDFKGASEVLALARRSKDFTLRLPYLENYISREGRNYILLCSLSSYYKFISDEVGSLRRYLFESNVRDYLGEVAINQNIQTTLESNDSSRKIDFWWLNNGVTILGTAASVVGKELCIENVQIVNGLQTTETVYKHFSKNPSVEDDRAILVKLILAPEDETRARIIKATNYQNTVDLGSLRGLDKIQRDIESFLSDRGWFYDRRKNMYKNQGKPFDRIVTIPYLASAVRAIALGDPSRSQRQRSRSLSDENVYKQVFSESWDLNVYLVSLEIIRAIELQLNTKRSTWDSPPIALAHFIGFVYTCQKLGRYRYGPSEVAKLVGQKPSKEEVLRVAEDLRKASARLPARGRVFQGIRLNKDFIDEYAAQFTAEPR